MEEKRELKSHITDLAERSFEHNVYTFSGFLSMAEQAEILAFEHEIRYAGFSFFGGTDSCERQMIRFGTPETLGYEEDFPISCVEIKPLNKKFSDNLTHRDFLGALMNLGIERDRTGDIIVRDNTAYVFAETKMADYICETLSQVKHTSVICKVDAKCPDEAAPVTEEEQFIISSERCDAVLAAVYRISRTKSNELFSEKSVFINGRQCEKTSAKLNGGDIISVRGFGKFIYGGSLGDTRKGRLKITIKKYI